MLTGLDLLYSDSGNCYVMHCRTSFCCYAMLLTPAPSSCHLTAGVLCCYRNQRGEMTSPDIIQFWQSIEIGNGLLTLAWVSDSMQSLPLASYNLYWVPVFWNCSSLDFIYCLVYFMVLTHGLNSAFVNSYWIVTQIEPPILIQGNFWLLSSSITTGTTHCQSKRTPRTTTCGPTS